MTCIELQESLEEVEDGSTAAQRAHLRSCPACSALLKELNLIVAAAGRLQEADEPSPRVWNSIEIALRREGLIRPQANRPISPSFISRWGAAQWFVPVTAILVLAAGIIVHDVRDRAERVESGPQASLIIPSVNQAVNQVDLNDDDLIQEVSENAPALKAQYEENLRRVNDSIRDDQTLVEESPNDEDARRSLMDAYQQKSMLFEMAMDRSLP
jgi:hypothetical protein